MTLDVTSIRRDFPILEKPVIYLDSACMSLKPQQVIDAMTRYYTDYTACAGRSAHQFARKVEEELNKVRHATKEFMGAKHDDEIIFVRNATEALNIVAGSLALVAGDEVLLGDKEHNSNLIPWLRLKDQGVTIRIVKSNHECAFDSTAWSAALTPKTKVVAIGHMSNLDGSSVPLKDLIKLAHKHGALVVADGAQSVPHYQINVRDLDVDFLAFSGHKMLGPSGIGILYGKRELLKRLRPFIVGGHTVMDATYEGFTLEDAPAKFEAGLQDYGGIIGFGAALAYLKKIGMHNISAHERHLNTLLTSLLSDHPKINLLGPNDPALRGGIFSFNVQGMESHQVALTLDASSNILVRSGAHCVHAWFNAHNLSGSVRASMYLYNTEDEIRQLAKAVLQIAKLS